MLKSETSQTVVSIFSQLESDRSNMKIKSILLGGLVAVCGIVCNLHAQVEVLTVQGALPRLNYRDPQGKLLWALPANSVLWKLDGPINSGVVVCTAAATSNSIVLNEGGVSIRGTGFPSAKLHVGTINSADQPGEVLVDPGNPNSQPIISAVNGNTPAQMILESRKAGSFSSFRMISTNGDYSQTVATVYAIRDNKNGVIPFMINPGKKNAFSLVISGGNVGLGITNPTSPLELANGAKCTVGGVWTNASSRQLKDNIEALSLDQALDVVRTLEPVTYTYKAEPDEPQVGFIAEDVPELVATQSRKELSPMDIVGVLTKVVQDQQARLDAQEDQLKKQNELLKQQQQMLEVLAGKLK